MGKRKVQNRSRRNQKSKEKKKRQFTSEIFKCPKGVDKATWTEIEKKDEELTEFFNSLPAENWGFADDVMESLREFKHKIVESKLTKKQQRTMPRNERQRLARLNPEIPRTVSEILEWQRISGTSALPNDGMKKPSLLSKRPFFSDASGPSTSGGDGLQQQPPPEGTGKEESGNKDDQKSSKKAKKKSKCLENDVTGEAKKIDSAKKLATSKLESNAPKSDKEHKQQKLTEAEGVNDVKLANDDQTKNGVVGKTGSGSDDLVTMNNKSRLVGDRSEAGQILRAKIEALRNKSNKSAHEVSDLQRLRRKLNRVKRKGEKREEKSNGA